MKIKYNHTECRLCCKGEQGVVGEKGMGCESPARNCRCVYRSFYVRRRKPVIGKLRRQSIKLLDYNILYGASHKTCFDIIS